MCPDTPSMLAFISYDWLLICPFHVTCSLPSLTNLKMTTKLSPMLETSAGGTYLWRTYLHVASYCWAVGWDIGLSQRPRGRGARATIVPPVENFVGFFGKCSVSLNLSEKFQNLLRCSNLLRVLHS